MLIYEKKVGEERHLFGTMGNIPAENDVQLTYKDAQGTVITPVEGDSYVDNHKGGIVRKSDEKAVNVFIGNTCVIGEEPAVVANKAVKQEAPKAVKKEAAKPVVEETKEVTVEEPVKPEVE